jgi:mannosyltransferase OCH1-like enzyme
MEDFLKENPSEEFPALLDVYHSFLHGADLFRYYYLYLNGGTYLDSDAVLERNIEEIACGYDFVTIQAYHETDPLMFNGFLIALPKVTIMYEALKKAYMTKN